MPQPISTSESKQTSLLTENAGLALTKEATSLPPAFDPAIYPIRPATTKTSILPIILPPATLRPVAFRIFTKKHSLTLTSSALQLLATFVGRFCGTEWRESGLVEPVLEEAARSWKKRNGGVIVDGERREFKEIMESLEGSMVGGKIVLSKDAFHQNSLALGSSQLTQVNQTRLGIRPQHLDREDSQLLQPNLGTVDVSDEEDETPQDPRKWLKVIDAFEQPRLIYNVGKKHFDRETSKPSLFPPASRKTRLFRNRYNLIHQRLLRNKSFQVPAFQPSQSAQDGASDVLEESQRTYRLTPISNLLGRNGTNHMILGLLTTSTVGTLAISDLTGSIALDLTHARPIPEDGAWFVPGMIILVDGTYLGEDNASGAELGGVGGSVGGKFVGFGVGGPTCERRAATLGLTGIDSSTVGGGFGWVDFLGVGSERAVGSKMRKIEENLMWTSRSKTGSGGRGRVVILGEVNLDQPTTLQALKKLFGLYATETEADCPMAFVLMGNFVQYAVMAHGGSGSIEYKEYFDSLAALLSEYPLLLQNSSFIFVPGDNDGWASAFGAGAATALPRPGIPEIFTSRVKRAFTTANAEAEKDHGQKTSGEAIWTSNPSRLSLLGTTHEILLFRDDLSSRFRRSAIRFSPLTTIAQCEDKTIDLPSPRAISDTEPTVAKSQSPPRQSDIITSDPFLKNTRKLVKTILDQGYLSPFPLARRPVLWDYASVLQIYPLPTAIVLADAEVPAFSITYEGCCAMNPGRLVLSERKNMASWVEYDVKQKKGTIRELNFC
ncbi:unnamed protein product [Blumeria hordei]|uniref:DNA polymerase epsilon subunit B n=1 Tax=Blumeria hordei TaxID=2867405 RepID=A0A383V144_BLUHO|nr:unnamed protein product [Blumeria hordei]